MSIEHRVFGPPGTGKTTFLSRWIKQTAEKYGSDSLIATSFTRAAATELVGRGLPLDRQRIGTLHSFAYRAIGGGVIAEKKLIGEWNKSHAGLALTDETASVDDFTGPAGGRNEGDELFAAIQRHRAQMIPPQPGLWEDRELNFHEKWQQFKQDTGSIDFTDMIELALAHELTPPVPFDYLFADECQDLTRLELALIRYWGEHCQAVVLAGDDDQAIYWFKGALADAFLTPPIPPEQKRVLGQSYRVPRQIVHYANAWIRDVKFREVKDYAPRDVEGEIVWKPAIQYARPTSILADLERDLGKTIIEPDGKPRPYTVMILATCAYMVDKIKLELRRQGVPFANRFRRHRGDWNPLHPGRGIGIAQRLLAYLAPYRTQTLWSGEELKWWGAMLLADETLIRGAKTKISTLTGIKPLDEAALRGWFQSDALERGLRAALKCDTAWLLAHTSKQYTYPLEYPAKVLNRYGMDALRPENEPPVLVGTIHSVKGGQADCSPPDEPVLTPRGWIPIGDLDPEWDRVVSFNSDHHKIHRGGPRRQHGYQFTKVERPYSGSMFTLTTSDSQTRVTPNHYFTVRWSEKAMSGKFIVYLMKRGKDWRIGVTGLSRQNNVGSHVSGLAMRMQHEGAEQGWVLDVFDSMQEALYFETLWSQQYGVPDLVFRITERSKPNNQLTQKHMDLIWQEIISESGALSLLAACGRDPRYPFLDEAPTVHRRRQSGTRNRWTVRACNLLPGMMELPTDPGKGQDPHWLPFDINEEQYDGPVYSLDVERWHHYVSGGAVVHNCVYIFPDLAPPAVRQWQDFTSDAHDALIRTFYVGFTRAREKLVLCGPSSGATVRFPMSIPAPVSEDL